MRRIQFGWIVAVFCCVAAQAAADDAFIESVAAKISDLSWNSGNAAELAKAQEASFALHEANGTLDLRLKALGRYADDEAMQGLIARHPAYLDFFLRLQNPEDFAAGFDDFSGDQTRREALLEALLLNPGPEGQRQFEHVVTRWGSVLDTLRGPA